MSRRQGCCTNQLGCCFGGLGCRFCCSCCPTANESTTTRLMYTLVLFLGTGFMCLSLTPNLEEILNLEIPELGTTCELLKIGEKCDLIVGYMAVYRTAFILSGFFFLMSLFTVGVTDSNGFRARFHNGAWIWKFLMLIAILVGVFFIPSERLQHFEIVWMYIALVGAVGFILIQLWLLVFFARSLSNKINQRVAEGGSAACWYSVSFLCTLLCYAIAVTGTMAMFAYFTTWDGCQLNKFFIGINAALCLLLSVASVVICCGPKQTHSALLQSGIISVYITYLTWTAISSAPREPLPVLEPRNAFNSTSLASIDQSRSLSDQKYYCGPESIAFEYNEFVLPYIGVAIMFFTVVYSSIGTSAENSVALGIGNKRDSTYQGASSFSLCSCFNSTSEDSAYDKRDDEPLDGGQRILRNERNGTVYSYSLFHVIYCLACMYEMMTLTAWIRDDKPTVTSFNQNWPTVWVKMGSSWACVLLYLIALPLRRFGHNHRIGTLDDGRGSRIPTREIYERETVT